MVPLEIQQGFQVARAGGVPVLGDLDVEESRLLHVILLQHAEEGRVELRGQKGGIANAVGQHVGQGLFERAVREHRGVHVGAEQGLGARLLLGFRPNAGPDRVVVDAVLVHVPPVPRVVHSGPATLLRARRLADRRCACATLAIQRILVESETLVAPRLVHAGVEWGGLGPFRSSVSWRRLGRGVLPAVLVPRRGLLLAATADAVATLAPQPKSFSRARQGHRRPAAGLERRRRRGPHAATTRKWRASPHFFKARR
mmetsp:Transcript_15786/g.40205  ORF Transcript_15786/g.40205 Transcript_15786/m.40205 type:complete len:256 (+) Transcript_15786:949-1716(+)